MKSLLKDYLKKLRLSEILLQISIARKKILYHLDKFIPLIISSPYVRIARLHQPHAYALLVIPVFWIIALYSHDWSTRISNFLIFGLGGIIMRSAGCIINDIWDRKIDSQIERTKNRPLANGELSVKQALILLFILLLIAALLLSYLSYSAIFVGCIALIATILYPIAKRYTHFAQVILGFTFNIGIIMACLNINNIIGFVSIMLYFAAAFWTIGYDTIYGCQDIADDRKIDLKSTSIFFEKNLPQVVWAFYKIALFLIAIAGFHANLHLIFFIFLGFGAYKLYLQTERVNTSDVQSCRKTFNSNVFFALLILVGIILG